MKGGNPFTVGFEICSSFWKLENTINGLMLMPIENVIRLENPSLHAVLAVAYDDDAYTSLVTSRYGVHVIFTQ